MSFSSWNYTIYADRQWHKIRCSEHVLYCRKPPRKMSECILKENMDAYTNLTDSIFHLILLSNSKKTCVKRAQTTLRNIQRRKLYKSFKKSPPIQPYKTKKDVSGGNDIRYVFWRRASGVIVSTPACLNQQKKQGGRASPTFTLCLWLSASYIGRVVRQLPILKEREGERERLSPSKMSMKNVHTRSSHPQ